MENNESPEIIDLASPSPVMDVARDGFGTFRDEFDALLYELYSTKPLPKNRQKVKVSVSNIHYDDKDFPIRYVMEKTYTFGYLCRCYRNLFGKAFDMEAYKHEDDHWAERWQKEGERRGAWGLYTQTMYMVKKEEQRAKFEALSPDEQEKEKKRMREKGSGAVMFIGG